MSLETFVSKAEDQVGNGGKTYTTWFGVPESTAWCAIFVSWCANEADILTTEATASPPDVYKTAGVAAMRQWYNDNHRAFVISASPTSSNYPKPGDIVTVATGSDPTEHTHVAIVVATDGNKITTVEGNLGRTNPIVKEVTYTDLYAEGYGTLLWVLSNHTSW
ncbi:MAG: CHAP domain-containing protein [Ruminococcus sp.]|nr:CHAP domain-containing protein [Ruminococcus sp.]